MNLPPVPPSSPPPSSPPVGLVFVFCVRVCVRVYGLGCGTAYTTRLLCMEGASVHISPLLPAPLPAPLPTSLHILHICRDTQRWRASSTHAADTCPPPHMHCRLLRQACAAQALEEEEAEEQENAEEAEATEAATAAALAPACLLRGLPVGTWPWWRPALIHLASRASVAAQCTQWLRTPIQTPIRAPMSHRRCPRCHARSFRSIIAFCSHLVLGVLGRRVMLLGHLSLSLSLSL